jgi:hypothetical protein
MDYRPAAISKHFQRYKLFENRIFVFIIFFFRRKYVTGVNSITTHPYLRYN